MVANGPLNKVTILATANVTEHKDSDFNQANDWFG